MKGQRLFQRTVEKTHDISCSKKCVRGYLENTEPNFVLQRFAKQNIAPLVYIAGAQIKTLCSFLKSAHPPALLKKNKATSRGVKNGLWWRLIRYGAE